MVMDYSKIPVGFGMALAVNPPALNAYSAMNEEEKQAVLAKAYSAKSEQEMHRIVDGLAASRTQ